VSEIARRRWHISFRAGRDGGSQVDKVEVVEWPLSRDRLVVMTIPAL
jgi:hypothetical protein